MADVSVRPARDEDAEPVARVQLATWRQAYDRLLPAEVLDTPVEQVAEAWRQAVVTPPTPGHRVLVALERDVVVGFAAVAPAEDAPDDPATVELVALLVEPRWGRRGHGSRLVAAAVDGWREQGARRALCWAFAGDPATLAFLRSAGWEPDGAARGLDTGEGVRRQVRLHVDLT